MLFLILTGFQPCSKVLPWSQIQEDTWSAVAITCDLKAFALRMLPKLSEMIWQQFCVSVWHDNHWVNVTVWTTVLSGRWFINYACVGSYLILLWNLMESSQFGGKDDDARWLSQQLWDSFSFMFLVFPLILYLFSWVDQAVNPLPSECPPCML